MTISLDISAYSHARSTLGNLLRSHPQLHRFIGHRHCLLQLLLIPRVTRHLHRLLPCILTPFQYLFSKLADLKVVFETPLEMVVVQLPFLLLDLAVRCCEWVQEKTNPFATRIAFYLLLDATMMSFSWSKWLVLAGFDGFPHCAYFK